MKALVLSAAIFLSVCVPASAGVAQPMPEHEAKQVCAGLVIQFLTEYQQLKAQGVSEETLLDLSGPPDIVAAAQRFIRAEMRGDDEAAAAAIDEIYGLCVAARMNPKTRM